MGSRTFSGSNSLQLIKRIYGSLQFVKRGLPKPGSEPIRLTHVMRHVFSV